MTDNNADSAILLVVEAKTGDILAWASRPTLTRICSARSAGRR